MTKIDQSQEKTASEPNNSLVASNTRRTIIKGATVAVPVVMTLRSGAAMALTSTEQCVDQSQMQAQGLQDDGKLPQFRNNDPNNVETFLRVEVNWARLIRIKRDLTDSYWVYDKKSDGSLRKAAIYNHDLSVPPANTWMNTGDPQKQFFDQMANIDVYDSESSGPPTAPVITGGHFNNGSKDFVWETGRIKFGLVITDASGVPETDILGGVRVGKIVSSGVLQTNHITGSCLTSMNPNSP